MIIGSQQFVIWESKYRNMEPDIEYDPVFADRDNSCGQPNSLAGAENAFAF